MVASQILGLLLLTILGGYTFGYRHGRADERDRRRRKARGRA